MGLYDLHVKNLSSGMSISESLSKAIIEHERTFRPEEPKESRPHRKDKPKKWPKDPVGGWQ